MKRQSNSKIAREFKQVFLQRRWVYVGCTEIYNLSSETMVAMWEFPQGKGKECFLGRAIGNKEPMAFLLAKSSPERVFLFPIGYVIVTGYDTQLYILRFLFISFFLTLVKHKCTFNTTGYIVFGKNMWTYFSFKRSMLSYRECFLYSNINNTIEMNHTILIFLCVS